MKNLSVRPAFEEFSGSFLAIHLFNKTLHVAHKRHQFAPFSDGRSGVTAMLYGVSIALGGARCVAASMAMTARNRPATTHIRLWQSKFVFQAVFQLPAAGDAGWIGERSVVDAVGREFKGDAVNFVPLDSDECLC